MELEYSCAHRLLEEQLSFFDRFAKEICDRLDIPRITIIWVGLRIVGARHSDYYEFLNYHPSHSTSAQNLGLIFLEEMNSSDLARWKNYAESQFTQIKNLCERNDFYGFEYLQPIQVKHLLTEMVNP